jgi:hypothetical protein
LFEQMFDATRVAVTSTPISTRVGPGVDECRGGAMRQYDDPVEVRRGEAEDPDQFLWRGRLWKVRAVVAHWVETGPWWQHAGVRAVIGSEDAAPLPDPRPDPRSTDPGSTDQDSTGPGAGGVLTALEDLLGERELWRVEAGRGSAGTGPGDGTFDLAYDEADGRWQLVGCTD